MNKIKSYFVAHKIISSIVLLIIILGGYWGYKKITNTSGDNRYVTAEVQKGTVIVSVSGSGQVSSSNQVDIKAKVSGDVSYIGAISGQKIGTGGTIVELATKDADKAVRDAEVNLESAQLVLDKIKKPADDLSITESQDTLDKANQSKQNAQNDLKNAHSNGFNVVTNAYLDLPNIMTGLNDMFFKSSAGTQQQWNIDWYQGQVASGDNDQTVILKQKFIDSYNKAKASFDINTNNFKITSTASDDATIETLISQTYDSVKLISDAIKNAGNYLDFVNSSILKNTEAVTPAILTTHKAILNTDTSKVNTALTNLSSASTTIENSKQAITNADQTITENTQSLSKLQAGADVLDIQSAELSVKQKANTLQDAKDNLADYFIRAPFSGTVAVVNTKKSDSVSAGTVVATLITNSQLAEISLNEVDVAKIKIGQKATLTFDAIPDLTISGVVADIDTIGTVSQGVVTYAVKISFDTQDARVKSAMSVSAAIITDIKQDVVVVPNGAIKSQAGTSYVEMFGAPLVPATDGSIGAISKITPNKIPVEIGLSNDSQSEITSGINEGDEIVTRTITPTTSPTTTAPSLFGSAANRGGGGAARIPTGR